jgi:hypothetical protein
MTQADLRAAAGPARWPGHALPRRYDRIQAGVLFQARHQHARADIFPVTMIDHEPGLPSRNDICARRATGRHPGQPSRRVPPLGFEASQVTAAGASERATDLDRSES